MKNFVFVFAFVTGQTYDDYSNKDYLRLSFYGKRSNSSLTLRRPNLLGVHGPVSPDLFENGEGAVRSL